MYGSITDEFADSTNPMSKPNSAWICWVQLKLWPFRDILRILAKIWLPWQRPLDPCKHKCLLWIGWQQKPAVVSNHIFVISHRNAFICICSNFSANIGCHGNAPLSLVTDEFCDSRNFVSSQNQTLHGYVAYSWSSGHFVIFLPILAKIWLPWQRPLDPSYQKCFLWISRRRNLRYK